jgi:hypothetical protein
VKNSFIKFSILFLFLFFSFQIVSAYSVNYSQYFGGKITNTKATEIEALESVGYICDVNGTSITINPVKGPASYIIPYTTISKTKNPLMIGKWIIGKYGGKTTVTCTMECGVTECVDTVDLDTITLFGNS